MSVIQPTLWFPTFRGQSLFWVEDQFQDAVCPSIRNSESELNCSYGGSSFQLFVSSLIRSQRHLGRALLPRLLASSGQPSLAGRGQVIPAANQATAGTSIFNQSRSSTITLS